jgi:hypothetical protein
VTLTGRSNWAACHEKPLQNMSYSITFQINAIKGLEIRNKIIDSRIWQSPYALFSYTKGAKNLSSHRHHKFSWR